MEFITSKRILPPLETYNKHSIPEGNLTSFPSNH